MAGGMPLAFTQEDFLVIKCKHLHLQPWIPFFASNGDAHANAKCKQALNFECLLPLKAYLYTPSQRPSPSKFIIVPMVMDTFDRHNGLCNFDRDRHEHGDGMCEQAFTLRTVH